MLTIVPFQPEHVALMDIQDEQIDAIESMTPEMLAALAAEPSWTALGDDGEVIACAGVSSAPHPMSQAALIAMRKGGVSATPRTAAMGWALVSEYAGPYMLPLTRAIRHMVQNGFAPARMIMVRRGFDAGERWASLLGFRAIDGAVSFGGQSMVVYERAFHG